jgi:hypothetical protein
MASVTATRPAPKSSRKPTRVELTLHLNGTPYVVVVIDPGPDNTKAVRLVKHGNADSVYDCCSTREGVLRCDCPDFEARSGNQVGYRCKHLTGLATFGLLEAPGAKGTHLMSTPAFVHVPDEFDEPDPRDVYNTHREMLAALAEAEEQVRAEGEADLLKVPVDPPARAVPAFDADFYRAQDAVAERRALWLAHRHFHTADPLPKPAPVPCCDPVEPAACEACATVHTPLHTLPDDLSGADWDDSATWELGPDTDPFPAWIAHQAAEHAKIGGERHAWLAGRIARLAEQACFFDATGPDSFDDRLEAQLDAARDAAEARRDARC